MTWKSMSPMRVKEEGKTQKKWAIFSLVPRDHLPGISINGLY